jgi:hypothetical protein
MSDRDPDPFTVFICMVFLLPSVIAFAVWAGV